MVLFVRILVVLSLLVAATLVLRNRSPDDPPRNVATVDTTYLLGEVVPDFSFVDLHGDTTTLINYAHGEPLVIAARDALCPVSRRYGPTTARLSGEYETRGVRFLYVNVSPLDTLEQMLDDTNRYQLSGAYTHDPDWRVAGMLGMITTGEVFLLDGNRRVRYRGGIDDQYGIRFTRPSPRKNHLRSALDELLTGDDITTPSSLPEGCYLASDIRHRVDQPEMEPH